MVIPRAAYMVYRPVSVLQRVKISNLRAESMCPCENMAWYMEHLLGLASEDRTLSR